jgi:hypothetical protein
MSQDWFDKHVIITGDASEEFKQKLAAKLRADLNARAQQDPRANRTKKRFNIVVTKEQESKTC